jgi:hypothetical protein
MITNDWYKQNVSKLYWNIAVPCTPQMTKLKVQRPSSVIQPMINEDWNMTFGNTMDLLLRSYNSKEEQSQENYWIHSLDLPLSLPPHSEQRINWWEGLTCCNVN